ncbi:phosphoglycerate mutase-like protein [Suillus fuscotomentosus]|uniref:Phosphoglycerate mutase-like protein n=1 Tax=Suillus fuscotomentosus TaxID=1912939 RepID=A0AAD4HEJ8_9AGAM|nr:phosphoglycerate mutase-like protein [Suillus fuscotomentosus]KAG1891689.1 phosphoglycerate mutase-like protein [Suillus fuscotomentosus]
MTVVARLYVIRHGETEWNRARIIQGQADSQLNDLGETQAAMTGEALKAIHFDKAFTSDLSRASKTAEIILQHHPDVILVKDQDLRERFMGKLQGTKGPTNPSEPSLEPIEAMIERSVGWYNREIVPYISSLADNPDGRCRNILVTSHGWLIKSFFKFMTATGMLECTESLLGASPRIPNASLSVVEYSTIGSGSEQRIESTVVQYGDASHLTGTQILHDNADMDALKS